MKIIILILSFACISCSLEARLYYDPSTGRTYFDVRGDEPKRESSQRPSPPVRRDSNIPLDSRQEKNRFGTEQDPIYEKDEPLGPQYFPGMKRDTEEVPELLEENEASD